MGTLPSKDEGMGMCWSWFSASKWQESQRIGVLFLDWEWVKMMNQFPKIDGSAPLKIAIFVGPKDTPLMWLWENAWESSFPPCGPLYLDQDPSQYLTPANSDARNWKNTLQTVGFHKGMSECLKNSGILPTRTRVVSFQNHPTSERAWYRPVWCPKNLLEVLFQPHPASMTRMCLRYFEVSPGKQWETVSACFSHKTTYTLRQSVTWLAG